MTQPAEPVEGARGTPSARKTELPLRSLGCLKLLRGARVYHGKNLGVSLPTKFNQGSDIYRRKYNGQDISRLRAHGQGVRRAAYWRSLGFTNLERARAVQAATGRWNGYAVAKLKAALEDERVSETLPPPMARRRRERL